jgi:hypothetical protein
VLLAAAVVVVLAGTLAARLIASSRSASGTPAAPAAWVPAPKSLAVEELEVPCWSCPYSTGWPLRFQTDLDLLAPLGDGPANAAEYFKDFNKGDGVRLSEAEAALEARVEGPEWIGPVLAPDYPLLLEAEPWCDQARMSFYDGIFESQGFKTRVPNLLYMLALARSWIARGVASEDRAAALEDLRRAIRLGRLLRQEDVVIINDLVGLACIHLGARGVWEVAMRDNDVELALLASVVLGEVAPQRLLTSERTTSENVVRPTTSDDPDSIVYEVDDERLGRAIEVATGSPDRRFRAEALLGLKAVRQFGDQEQQRRVMEVLDELSLSDDEVIATSARWARDTDYDAEELAIAFPSP